MILYQNAVKKSIGICVYFLGSGASFSVPETALQPICDIYGIISKQRKGIIIMKRFVCMLCAALLLLCGCARAFEPSLTPAANTDPKEAPKELPYFPVPVIEGYADFSDVLSAKLIDGTENKNLSPISVYLALAMVAEGAEGQTQTDMLKLLGAGSPEELRNICGAMLSSLSVDTEESTLALANSIWLADRGGKLNFREAYLKELAETYRSEANAVDFSETKTAKQIADWITKHTHGKIKISEDAMQFEPDTIAVLINTIYLKDAWRDEFYEGANETGLFDGTQTVEYMNRKDNGVTIVKGDGFLRYSLPLLRVGRMTFVLPDEGTPLASLLGTPEKLHALLNDGEELRANVSVKLPKFAFQDRFDLNDALEALGIAVAFSDEADFSAMCDIPAKISRVIQESYIGIDEKGVEAAAYTMVVMDECAALPEELPEIDFHLTRPFLYVIESYDGTVLFVGTVTAPTPAN